MKPHKQEVLRVYYKGQLVSVITVKSAPTKQELEKLQEWARKQWGTDEPSGGA